MSDTRELHIIGGGTPSEGLSGYSLHAVGVQGSWIVSVWTKESTKADGKYKESKTIFFNQQGELIAVYSESSLSERRVAEESSEKKP